VSESFDIVYIGNHSLVVSYLIEENIYCLFV
jgi:hypothetical protein